MSTYVPLSTVTLTSTASSVTLSGIPQIYNDLVLVISHVASASSTASIRFNDDANSNYSFTQIFGNGSTASSGRGSNQTSASIGYPFTSQGVTTVHIQSYSNTTTNKTVLSRDSNASNFVASLIGLWRSTSAINSFTVLLSTGTFNTGSTFTLYGVGEGSPKAFGGDEVFTDGTYWYHTFRASGVFAPTQALSCDYVVVAGGGGGAAGGSGAGGFRTSIGGSPLSLGAGNYTITVGAGGTGSTGGVYGGAGTGQSKGNNSVFSTITAEGGGRAGGAFSGEGSTSPSAQLSGGSGGGASYSSGQAVYGAGTSGQGFNGGQDVFDGAPYAAAGGGGAGAAGQNNQSNSVAGAGGAGTFNAITNAAKVGQLSSSNYYLAGGGGGGVYGGAGSGTGGAGGLGGGGAGAAGTSTTQQGTAGTANTGGGAGGSAWQANGVSGGSGVVIVRYAV